MRPAGRSSRRHPHGGLLMSRDIPTACTEVLLERGCGQTWRCMGPGPFALFNQGSQNYTPARQGVTLSPPRHQPHRAARSRRSPAVAAQQRLARPTLQEQPPAGDRRPLPRGRIEYRCHHIEGLREVARGEGCAKAPIDAFDSGCSLLCRGRRSPRGMWRLQHNLNRSVADRCRPVSGVRHRVGTDLWTSGRRRDAVGRTSS